ncbi:MAG: hypothetical protein RLP02_12255 [Coleofasciculus sp. C2-GNP5-27]
MGSEQDAQCSEQDAQCSKQDAQCSEQDARTTARISPLSPHHPITPSPQN